VIREMKDSYPHIALVRFCRSFGVTRQAYYQHFWNAQALGIEQELVIKEVLAIRKDHKRLGTRKMLVKLDGFLHRHAIKMGRDALFDLLADHGLLVKRLRKYVHTTRSTHWLRKWPNLIKGMAINKPGQVWVSDITYFKTGKEGYVYITLITDAYSHKIMGHHLSTDLETASCIQALHMAVHNEGKVTKGLIHHSDRGVQYCSNAYVELLQEHGIAISMTENGDPLENAIAERINGILKQEYLDQWNLTTMAETVVALDRAVLLYNSDRPHNSIANHTPDEAHKGPGGLTRSWKNYYPQRPAVNPEQDIVRPVNLSSDTTLNL